MSYILDALRRADRERQRHDVPTVHTMQSTAPPLEHEPQRASPWAWAMAAGAAALLGVAAWAWWFEPERGPEPYAASGAGQNPALRPMPAMPPLAPAEMPAQVVAALSDAPVAARASDPPAAATTPTLPTAPIAPAGRRAPPSREGVSPQLKLDTTIQPAKLAPPPLPSGLRSELGLSIDGAIFSARKEDRLLIVGGQLFREGEKLREDLVLETIQPKSAVIRHKGQRYTVAF